MAEYGGPAGRQAVEPAPEVKRILIYQLGLYIIANMEATVFSELRNIPESLP
jgi:hypothetical protein